MNAKRAELRERRPCRSISKLNAAGRYAETREFFGLFTLLARSSCREPPTLSAIPDELDRVQSSLSPRLLLVAERP